MRALIDRAENINLESPAGGSQPGRSIRSISPLLLSKRFCVQQNRCPRALRLSGPILTRKWVVRGGRYAPAARLASSSSSSFKRFCVQQNRSPRAETFRRAAMNSTARRRAWPEPGSVKVPPAEAEHPYYIILVLSVIILLLS